MNNDVKIILLIGSTGSGKSALANVLVGENKFRESASSTSETKKVQIQEFREEGVKYKIVDTVGIGDTGMILDKVLRKLALMGYSVKDGLSQIFFVIDGPIKREAKSTYDLLSKIIFDENIAEYTTIVRTGFSGFRKMDKCQKDKELIFKKSKILKELIERSGKDIVYIDNPPIIGDDELDESKKMRKDDSRNILLKHLKFVCQGDLYKPENLDKLSDMIGGYMENKRELKEKMNELNRGKPKVERWKDDLKEGMLGGAKWLKIMGLAKQNSFLNKKITKKMVEHLGNIDQELKKEIEKELENKNPTEWKWFKSDNNADKYLISELIETLKNKEKIIKELEVQRVEIKSLLKQLENKKTVEREQSSSEKEINYLRQKLEETERRETKLEAKLEAKQEEIERMGKTINEAMIMSRVQWNIGGNVAFNSQSINHNYQQLVTETEKRISESLTSKEITSEEQQIINKTILFLGTKELFINYRQASINSLIDCYNKLEKSGNKLDKFNTASSMMSVTEKLANIIPSGGISTGLIGDAINLVGTVIQERNLGKCIKEFQEILDKDEKNLPLFDDNYQSLIKAIWHDNRKNNQGKIISTIIDILKLEKTKPNPFSDDHNIFSSSVSGIWRGRSSLEVGEMKNSIILVISNLDKLKQRLQWEKEQLSKQDWFIALEEKTDLLQKQTQTQIETPPK